MSNDMFEVPRSRLEEMTAEIKRLTAENDKLRAIVQQDEDVINTILQPGMEWISLLREFKGAGECGVEWLGENGQYLDLHQARLIEALKAAAKQYPPR